MDYATLPISLGILALIMLIFSLRLLLSRGWLVAFLRGVFAIVLMGLAIGGILGAYDLYSYRQLMEEQVVADLHFTRLEDQYFKVELQAGEGKSAAYQLRGDSWQVDARFIKWKALLAQSGLQPAYRLERLSGRYDEVARERDMPRTVYEIHSSRGLDSWAFLHKLQNYVEVVDTHYGSATYLPMKDGAHYRVYATYHGLIARPANTLAEQALANWSS